MYDWKKTRLQRLDYARAEHPATDFIHFHLFCPFTHQATANVYFWPKGVEVKLFTKDYLNKRTAFTRLQMITSLPQETQHTELSFANQNNEGTSSYIQNQRGPWENAHIEDMNANWCVARYFLQKPERHLAWLWKRNKFNKCSIL